MRTWVIGGMVVALSAVAALGVTTPGQASELAEVPSAGGGVHVESAKPAANPIAEDVVAVAKRYVGTPYVYGGATPGGFDGPGLTMFAFAYVGVPLPHSISGQDRAGDRIEARDARPGDLVVADDLRQIGIYAGDGQMVAVFNEPGASVSIVPVFAGPHHFTRVVDARSAD